MSAPPEARVWDAWAPLPRALSPGPPGGHPQEPGGPPSCGMGLTPTPVHPPLPRWTLGPPAPPPRPPGRCLVFIKIIQQSAHAASNGRRPLPRAACRAAGAGPRHRPGWLPQGLDPSASGPGGALGRGARVRPSEGKAPPVLPSTGVCRAEGGARGALGLLRPEAETGLAFGVLAATPRGQHAMSQLPRRPSSPAPGHAGRHPRSCVGVRL